LHEAARNGISSGNKIVLSLGHRRNGKMITFVVSDKEKLNVLTTQSAKDAFVLYDELNAEGNGTLEVWENNYLVREFS
jgi:hypothetical protein